MKKIGVVLVFLSVLCLASCKKSEKPTEAVQQDLLQTVSFDSKALANNIVDEPTDKEFYVVLPPSYYTSEKSYPVVYYLHGQGDVASSFIYHNKGTLKAEFDKGAKEFILVGVNGSSNQGGAFYTNSPVSGNYEDYIVNEVVAYIDENYRTIAKRDYRGICGFSMGGFGAYNLAFRHPDVYSCVLSMSPGALADGELSIAMESWKNDSSFLTGYARAFSPKLEDADKKYGNIPTMDNSVEDLKIQKDWESGFGNINEKLDAYVALNNPLKAIKFTYGTRDSYKWIPSGCEFLANAMKEREIPYTMETVDTGHSLPPNAVVDYIVPFFNENLLYE